MKMRYTFLILFPFLLGCPKHTPKSLDEAEREEKLRELLEDEEFEDLPESGDGEAK